MTAPADTIDLIRAIREHAAPEAESLDTRATELEARAAEMRTRARTLRRLHDAAGEG